MATSSQVKTALDEIAAIMAAQRSVVEKAQSNAGLASAALAELPATYSDVITTIQNYGTTDAFEALAKAELAKLTTEFNAIKADADAIVAVNLND